MEQDIYYPMIRIRIAIAVMVLIAASSGFGQNNDIALGALGNFNPKNYVYLHGRQGTLNWEMVHSNKSALGGSGEYRRQLSDHYGVGILYEQNPSDGKLQYPLPGKTPTWFTSIWPQTRYTALGLLTERFALGKTSPFIQEGAGAIITNGYSNSGWSHNIALTYGMGIDVNLSARTFWRTAVAVSEQRSGCYGDHTCTSSWAAVQDVRTGIGIRW